MYEPLLAHAPRLLSLDALRGITMALMLLVDVAGDNISWLGHAKWSGLNLADFVMPAFLFTMGSAIGIKSGRPDYGRFLRLFFVGVFIQGSWLPINKVNVGIDLTQFRIMGILQRIGICYLLMSYLSLVKEKFQLLAVFTLVGVQTAISLFVQVPGCLASGDFSIACNSQAWIDRLVLGSNHMYTNEYDPEGLVSTLGCLLPTFVGFLAVKRARYRVSLSLGLILTGLAVRYSSNIPFNKALWTLPYNLVTAGGSLGLFALLDWCTISKANPFVHLGSNAILFFVMSDCGGVLSVFLNSVYVPTEEGNTGIVDLFLKVLHVQTHPKNILVFAIIQLAFYMVLTRVMFYKKIFYKI